MTQRGLELLCPFCIDKADMNKNGRVNSVDLDLLVKAIMGIKETE